MKVQITKVFFSFFFFGQHKKAKLHNLLHNPHAFLAHVYHSKEGTFGEIMIIQIL